MEKIAVARQLLYHEAQQPSKGHELANEMQTYPAETLTSQSNSSPTLVDGSATPYTSLRDSSGPFTNSTTTASTWPGLNLWSGFCNVPSSPDANSSDFVAEADSLWRRSSYYNTISCASSASQAQLDSVNYAEYFPHSFRGSDPLVQLHCRIRQNNSTADMGQLVPGFAVSDVAAPALEDPVQVSSTRRLKLIDSIFREESEYHCDSQLQPAHLQQGEGSAPHDDDDDDDGQTLDQIQLARARQFLFLDQERHHSHAELSPPASVFDDLRGMTKCSHGFGVPTSPAGATRKSECVLSSSSTGDTGSRLTEDYKLHETTITDFKSPGGEMNYMSTHATCSRTTGKRKRRPEREDIADPDSIQPAVLDRIDKKMGKSRSKPRPMREPRYAIKTRSNVDIMDDGFRWRKYGQKAVRDSPYPRNYYRCTTPHCPVRKRVERTLEDPGLVLTIYEGKHSHHHSSSSAGTAAAAAAVTHHHPPTDPGQQRSYYPNDEYFQLSSTLGHEFRAPPTAPTWPPPSLLHGQYHRELQVAALQDKFNMLRAYQLLKLQQQQEEFLITGFLNSTKLSLGPLGNFPGRMPSTNALRDSSSCSSNYAQAAPQLLRRVPDVGVSLGHETALYGPSTTVCGTLRPSVLSERLANYRPFSSASDHARTFGASEDDDQGFQVVPGQESTQRGLGDQHMTLEHTYASNEELDLLEDFRLPH